MTLRRYLSRMFVTRVAVAMLALAGLLQLVELMDKTDEILARGLGVAGMVRFAAYRFPLLLVPVQPIAVLMAALLTWAALTQRGEIAAMRTAGLSVARLVGLLMPVGLAVGAFGIALADWGAPAADAAFARWWQATAPAEVQPGGRLWFRDGLDVVGIDRIEPDGHVLTGIEVVRRGPDGGLAQWISAERAEWHGGGWTLVTGSRSEYGGERLRPFDREPWPTSIGPANMLQLARPEAVLSMRQLVAALDGRWATREPRRALETRLLNGLAAPLTTLLMIVLATPVAGGSPRSGRMSAGMAMGLAAGLSYLLLDGILGVLGEAGTLPPVLAAWVAPAAFACIGGALVLHVEG